MWEGWVLSLSVELTHSNKLFETCITDTTSTSNCLHLHTHLTVWLERTAQTHTDGFCFMRCQKKGFDEIGQVRDGYGLAVCKCGEPSWFHSVLLSGVPHILTFTCPRLRKCPFLTKSKACQCGAHRHVHTQSNPSIYWLKNKPWNISDLILKNKHLIEWFLWFLCGWHLLYIVLSAWDFVTFPNFINNAYEHDFDRNSVWVSGTPAVQHS